MWWSFGKRTLQVYGILWMTAAGGLVGANLVAIIAMMFFVSENKATEVAPWMAAGWWIGIAIAFIGSITGNLKLIQGSKSANRRELSIDDVRHEQEAESPDAADSPKEAPSGIMAHIAGGGLAGGICGLLLGASLLVFWFSLAYSPFAPRAVSSSVTVERESNPVANRPQNVFVSRSPVLIYLCVTPALIGTVAGATVFGIIGLKQRDPKSTRRGHGNY